MRQEDLAAEAVAGLVVPATALQPKQSSEVDLTWVALVSDSNET